MTLTSTLLLMALPSLVSAQAQPPNRFFGSVKINGQDAPDGTVVEAYIGNTLCGSGSVQNRNNAEIYLVDVVGAGQKAGCAKDGDTVKFKVAGLDAKETGKYATAEATHLDLTASGTPHNPSEPTVLAPGQGGTPLTPIATPNPTQEAAGTPPPAPPAGTAAPAAPAAPAVTGTPAGTPAATVAPTAAASLTATPPPGTATPPALTSPATRPAPRRSGPSPLVWIVPVVVLVIAAAIALLIYQRRGEA
jgi:hypothetical protein